MAEIATAFVQLAIKTKDKKLFDDYPLKDLSRLLIA